MAKTVPELTDELQRFIAAQPMFFVATAPRADEGHVNVSPKGLDTLRVLSRNEVAYLDLTGSGNETSAHLTENGRITLMFCAFSGRPKIVRLYGRGEVVASSSPSWDALVGLFPALPGIRQIVRIRLDRVQTSCGFGVPELEGARQREDLLAWAEKKGPDGLRDYRAKKNVVSVDGLPAAPWTTSTEIALMAESSLELVWPSAEHLPSCAAALEAGWSPDNMRPSAGRDELERIRRDPAAFLAGMVDREGKGPPILLPDGTTAPRLPGYTRWMWDGEFCGSIGFRRQPGTAALPPHCLGHIGYGVVPWKRRRGYATRALALLLADVRREEGMEYVELTTEVTNDASRRVIEANGGVLIERFLLPPQFGAKEDFRYRIHLGPRAPGPR
jgi:predicted acetyltransferase